METLGAFADVLLAHLAWTSAQAALLAGLLWTLCRLFPRLPSATRCLLWWLLGAQLLLGLCWHAPLRLPVWQAPAAAIAPAGPAVSPADTQGPTTTAAASTMPTPIAAAAAAPLPAAAPWRLALAALWLLGLAAQVPLAVRQWREARAVLGDSRPLDDAALQALCMRQAEAFGLRGCPRLRVSASIASPQVSGLWRPTVLLPAGHALTADELGMALAHELAHLRRGDLWLGWVPALARRLFFFHPLAALAAREYALDREAACDAEALRRGRQAPQDYGRLLLRLGVGRPTQAGLAGASPTFRNLRRRLERLQQAPPRRRAGAWLLVAAVALVGVAPYRLTAMPAATLQPGGPPMPPMPPAPPSPPPPGSAVTGPHRSTPRRHDVDIDAVEPAGPYAHALYQSDGVIDTVEVGGSHADVAEAKQLHAGSDAPMFWFRRGRQAYLIRDRVYVERARAIYEPVTAYWQDDGRLKGEEWKLRGPREGLMAWRESVQAQRREVLADRRTPGSDARLASLDDQQRDIDARLAALDRQLAALRPQLEAQAQRQQQVVEQADRRASALVDEALAKGLAQDARLR